MASWDASMLCTVPLERLKSVHRFLFPMKDFDFDFKLQIALSLFSYTSKLVSASIIVCSMCIRY